jgi:hypothetical protein
MANKHLRAVGDESETACPASGAPDDAKDFDALWIDPGLGDGIATETFHNVIVDKPKTFFRTHLDPTYRRRTELYTHKIEGVIGEQHFIIAPSMRGLIDGARPCTLVCVIYRDGSPRLWPIKFPKDGEKDNNAWISARSAARAAMEKWMRIVWVGGAYRTRAAAAGYAPDPDWGKLPPWKDLVTAGFGEHGIIRDKNHPIYRDQMGEKPERPAGDLSGDDLTDDDL